MTDKERLKIIRETPHYFTCDVMRKDFLYLFNQAEQIEIIKDTGRNFEQAALNYAEENKKLREALDFYAAEISWRPDETNYSDIQKYRWEIARKALEEIK
ncbi:hypothetical protein MKY29_12135 [Psychrobacillus sp. FSL K6-2365]|uniref:hypothetical protein n=1 Tax=Psychrobacillus sp. FSL K6-2365 TaxID=2921546 RepID=UPI0030FC6920